MEGICTEVQTMTLTCCICGSEFQISAGTLAERRADGQHDEDAQCLGCKRRWERAWDEHMNEQEGRHANAAV
jgi:hypothetical protein